MRTRSLWRSNSRRLALLLLAVAVPPAATLVWLGVQLLAQERSLVAQRELERRQIAMQRALRSLDRAVDQAERLLVHDPLDGRLPDGMVRLTLSAPRIDAEPTARVLWLPAPRALPPSEDARFAGAERLEFQSGASAAEAIYREAARSPDTAVRAGALLRLGRVLRRQHRLDEALRAYRELSAIATVAIAGAPADLQARRSMCAVLTDAGRADEAAREAAALAADLVAGRWLLDRPAWELTAGEIQQWTGRPLRGLEERRALSMVADALWQARPASDPARRLVVVDGSPVTVLSRGSGSDVVALALAPSVVRDWAAAALAGDSPAGVRLSLMAATGETVAGDRPGPSAQTLTAPASETRLPWSIVLDSSGAPAVRAEFESRRRLLTAGLVTILLLLGGGSYFLWRVLQRELAVARLQTEFVSAVSHEFRTPLTSMRNVTELLAENDDLPPERRRTFYEALDRNTDRLHRLVESLLDFARMEGGRKLYDFRRVDAGALAADVVADFRKEAVARGVTIDIDAAPADLPVDADAPALTNALWNLLDNAVKYSPDAPLVRVALARRNGHVQISVRDRGIGIPAHERASIFDKFHRGEQAHTLGIKGTGIGLAMVHEIVRAHQGRIDLESEAGRGSTFTIVLPLAVS